MSEGKEERDRDMETTSAREERLASQHCWVTFLGGTACYRDVPRGASFRFPKGDDTFTRQAGRWFTDERGNRFTTGAATAVVYPADAPLESLKEEEA